MVHPSRGTVAAAAGFAIAAAGVWAAAFRSAAGARVDQAILGGFLGLGTEHTEALATRAARLADPGAIVLFTAAMVALALRRRRARAGLMVLGVMAAANASTQALKRLTAEPRTLESLTTHVAPESWPSGHATAALTAGLCLIAVTPSRLRPLAAALGAALARGVGYAVLLLGWHFPSDVLGGYCVATAWTLIGLALLWAVERGGPRLATDRPPSRIPAAPLAVVLVIAGIGAALAAVALARLDPALVYDKPNAAFVVAALIIGAGACAPAAGLAAILAGSR